MWAEAMNKLEGMDSNDRERLWPELVHGFKDLSRRVKLQDEAITADVQRLQATEANVKLVHVSFSCPVSDCHFLYKKKTFDMAEVSFLIIPHNQQGLHMW
jgi:hypothetical protein